MRALENGPDHLSPEAASMHLTLERRLEGQPSAPGASHGLTKAQVEGLATPEPVDRKPTLAVREAVGVADAAQSFLREAFSKNSRAPDTLDDAPGRDGQSFFLIRTDARGAQSLRRIQEPFQSDGTIVSADAEHVTQRVGNSTLIYKTDDLLNAAPDRNHALRMLEHAVRNHEPANIVLKGHELDVTVRTSQELVGHPTPEATSGARADEHVRPVLHIFKDGRQQTVGDGYHQSGKVFNMGSFVAQESEHDGHTSLTMYPRQELVERTPPEQRAALNAALRDGHEVEIDINYGGLAVHDMTPAHQRAPEFARQRALEQPGKGHELGS